MVVWSRIGWKMACLLLILGSGCASAASFERDRLAVESQAGVYNFAIEVANTGEARAQGLMYREELAPDAGMLFDYGYPQRVSMWMKNTLIPLDMLFIRPDGTIEKIAMRTVPHSLEPIASLSSVRAVLELRGGIAEKLGIAVGDKVLHSIFGTAD